MRHSPWIRKSIEQIITEANAANFFKRHLDLWQLTMLGIGAIVGTGIFVLTGHAAAANAGPAVSLSFVLAGIAAFFSALCYAELASMIPVAGSAYTYAYVTMGEIFAWVIGWDLILEYLIGAATVSVGWSGYVVNFLRGWLHLEVPSQWTEAPFTYDPTVGAFVKTGSYLNLPAVLIVLLSVLMLLFGIRSSARANSVIVIIKLAAILLFIGIGAFHVVPANWMPFIPPNSGTFGHFGPSGVLQGAAAVFFAYIGFDALSTASQETKNPSRDVPMGILLSLVICTLLYVGVALVLTGLVPYAKLSVPHPISLGVEAIGSVWLGWFVNLGAIAGLSSVLLVFLLAQPRIFFAMAKDGLLPPFAAQMSERFGTPVVTTLICGGLCAATGGLLPIGVLSELTSIGTLFAFLLVSAGVMILRLQQPDASRKFKLPGGPYGIPLASILCNLVLIAMASFETLMRLLIWMVVGMFIYYFYGRKHSKMRSVREKAHV